MGLWCLRSLAVRGVAFRIHSYKGEKVCAREGGGGDDTTGGEKGRGGKGDIHQYCAQEITYLVYG